MVIFQIHYWARQRSHHILVTRSASNCNNHRAPLLAIFDVAVIGVPIRVGQGGQGDGELRPGHSATAGDIAHARQRIAGFGAKSMGFLDALPPISLSWGSWGGGAASRMELKVARPVVSLDALLNQLAAFVRLRNWNHGPRSSSHQPVPVEYYGDGARRLGGEASQRRNEPDGPPRAFWEDSEVGSTRIGGPPVARCNRAATPSCCPVSVQSQAVPCTG
jgi:hypothetical protein